jgi:hypothetical protein
MSKKFIENGFCKQWIEKDIIHCRFQPFLEIDLPTMKKCIADQLTITENIPMAMLADVRYLKYFNSEAREYLASPDGSKHLLAAAFLVATQIEKFLIRLFIEVNHPAVPCKIFTERKDAIEWLEFYNIKKKK